MCVNRIFAGKGVMQLKSFKDYLVDEDAPTNAVAGGGVDLAPTGKAVMRKMDRRSRWDVDKMYKRALGTRRETR
jgi:hypothetical protein